MGDIFVYILKSSLCLAVFYLFFMAALSRETLYRFNRIIIVALFILALALPLITVSVGSETPYSGVALNLDTLLAMADTEASAGAEPSVQNSLLVPVFTLYIIGVVIAFIKAIVSLFQMLRMLRLKDSERTKISGGITLVIHGREKAPFSWMKYIVISREDYNESGEEIITHELAHISNRHSLDLLAAEMIKIVHWFNPAAYLLKRELQNIHEYQADEAVINHGIDAKKYQLLLIKKAVGQRLFTLANSFNHGKLKKRITMMVREKSKKWAAIKALFILPAAAIALTAFASEKVSAKTELLSKAEITMPSIEMAPVVKDTVKVKKDSTVVKVIVKKTGDKSVKHIYINGKEVSEDSLKAFKIKVDTSMVKQNVMIAVSKKGVINNGEEVIVISNK